MHGPTDNPAGEQIKDRNQIQPALSCEHASGIGGPYLIKPLHGETSEPIRSNGSAVAAVSGSGSILRALPSVESLLAHEPGDAVASSWTTQGMSDSRATVGLATARKRRISASSSSTLRPALDSLLEALGSRSKCAHR